MDSRPTATQASKGRRLFRSAIAEAVASDPAQRVLASIRAPGRRSRTPIWVGLGVVVALTAAVTIGTTLRTGTPGGVATAPSAPAAAAPPSAQAPATTAPSGAQAGGPVAPADTTNTADTADTGTPVSTWDKVAQCESGGNWATSTGNGFHGGLQFTASTWRSFGGSGMPHQASRTEQIAVAERVLDAQGWKAWPACSRKLGLR
jgi:resuscitation-promoting factor RpfA